MGNMGPLIVSVLGAFHLGHTAPAHAHGTVHQIKNPNPTVNEMNLTKIVDETTKFKNKSIINEMDMDGGYEVTELVKTLSGITNKKNNETTEEAKENVEMMAKKLLEFIKVTNAETDYNVLVKKAAILNNFLDYLKENNMLSDLSKETMNDITQTMEQIKKGVAEANQIEPGMGDKIKKEANDVEKEEKIIEKMKEINQELKNLKTFDEVLADKEEGEILKNLKKQLGGEHSQQYSVKFLVSVKQKLDSLKNKTVKTDLNDLKKIVENSIYNKLISEISNKIETHDIYGQNKNELENDLKKILTLLDKIYSSNQQILLTTHIKVLEAYMNINQMNSKNPKIQGLLKKIKEAVENNSAKNKVYYNDTISVIVNNIEQNIKISDEKGFRKALTHLSNVLAQMKIHNVEISANNNARIAEVYHDLKTNPDLKPLLDKIKKEVNSILNENKNNAKVKHGMRM